MIFDDLLNNLTNSSSVDSISTSIYHLSDDNVDSIKILIKNCWRMGSDENTNVRLATIHPSVWMGEFLEKNWFKIKMVTSMPSFDLTRIEVDKLVTQTYSVRSIQIDTDNDLDLFFDNSKYKKLAIYSIVKYVNLCNMDSYYSIRYANTTQKYEERDNKINDILK